MLIEAKDLVNDISILQAEHIAKVEYFHIEFDAHDIILAEGALSESYIDDDNRGMFHNAHEYDALYPDAIRIAARYCAPRIDEGYKLEAIRRRIDARTRLHSAIPRPGSGAYEPGPLRGFVDVASQRLVAGWAQNVAYPEAPVCLDILIGDRVIGRTLASRYRDDLARAGLGSGRHGFAFVPSAEFIAAPEAIMVRRSLDGATLARSGAVQG